jgi:hypothetical protein
VEHYTTATVNRKSKVAGALTRRNCRLAYA